MDDYKFSIFSIFWGYSSQIITASTTVDADMFKAQNALIIDQLINPPVMHFRGTGDVEGSQ